VGFLFQKKFRFNSGFYKGRFGKKSIALLQSAITFDIIIMTKRKKRIVRLKQAKGDVPFKLIGQVLEDCGYDLVRTKGSHFYFQHFFFKTTISVPVHGGRIKPVYVRRIITLLGL